MRRLHAPPKLEHPDLLRSVRSQHLLPMRANARELLEVLLHHLPLALVTLLALELLGHAGVTEGWSARSAELLAVERKEGAVGDALDDLGAQSALLLAHAEGLEFDNRAKLAWGLRESLGLG